MPVEAAIEADPYHHRCRVHYAQWLVRDTERWTTARKTHRCVGCGNSVGPATRYKVGLQSNGLRYPTRVAVCVRCVEGALTDQAPRG